MATDTLDIRNQRAERSSKYMQLWGIAERNEQSWWTRIGVAFQNRDGSWYLQFDYLPARPEIKLQMREPREREEE
jgi:hypothetical protein